MNKIMIEPRTNQQKKAVAITQPCLFPYLGYYQLVFASTNFVFYDDITFMKGKWINRNRILANGRQLMFSLPLAHMSPNTLISETFINKNSFDSWKDKFLKTLMHSYSKAPYRDEALNLVYKVLHCGSYSITDLCHESIALVFQYMNIDIDISRSSLLPADLPRLTRVGRLVHIVKWYNSSIYINSAGGRLLYNPTQFDEHQIELMFLESDLPEYSQSSRSDHKFVPSLSIIDILMHCSADQMRQLMVCYRLGK